MKPFHLRSTHMKVLASLAVFMLAALWACGQKGPPIPPNQMPLPKATLLKAEVNGNRVTLRWKPVHENDAVAGYAVYRASYPLSGPACPTCHQQFHRIEDLPLGPGTREMTFSQQVPTGLRYTYKVRPYDSSGRLGFDSNPAAVEMP